MQSYNFRLVSLVSASALLLASMLTVRDALGQWESACMKSTGCVSCNTTVLPCEKGDRCPKVAPQDGHASRVPAIACNGLGDRVVLYQGQEGNGEEIRCLWSDNGTTWNELSPKLNSTNGTQSPAIAADDAGNWVALFLDFPNTRMYATHTTTANIKLGLSWSAPLLVGNQVGKADTSNAAVPEIARHDQLWVATWEYVDNSASGRVTVSYAETGSLDSWQTYRIPGTLEPALSAPHIATDGSVWLIVWRSNDGVRYRTTTTPKNENSWTPTQTISASGGRPAVAASKNSNWVIAWEAGGTISYVETTTADLTNSSPPPFSVKSLLIPSVSFFAKKPSVVTDGSTWTIAGYLGDVAGPTDTGAGVFVSSKCGASGPFSSAELITTPCNGGKRNASVATDGAKNWFVAFEHDSRVIDVASKTIPCQTAPEPTTCTCCLAPQVAYLDGADGEKRMIQYGRVLKTEQAGVFPFAKVTFADPPFESTPTILLTAYWDTSGFPTVGEGRWMPSAEAVVRETGPKSFTIYSDNAAAPSYCVNWAAVGVPAMQQAALRRNQKP